MLCCLSISKWKKSNNINGKGFQGHDLEAAAGPEIETG